MVEAQETWDVNKDPEREVKEVFVEVGDMIEEGAPLFEYDMETAKAELAQGELDLEEKQNEIRASGLNIQRKSRRKRMASSRRSMT